jgi:hypothetical protein
MSSREFESNLVPCQPLRATRALSIAPNVRQPV